MPELDGLGVVRTLKSASLPLIAFVTAYDEYAIRAFEVNAIDYLLKPVEKARLRETLNRAHERVEHAEIVAEQIARIGAAAEMYAAGSRPAFLDRIPVQEARRGPHPARQSDRLDRRRRRTPASDHGTRRAPHHHLPAQGPRSAPRPRSFSQAGPRHPCQHRPHCQGERHAGRDARCGSQHGPEAADQPTAVPDPSRAVPPAVDRSPQTTGRYTGRPQLTTRRHHIMTPVTASRGSEGEGGPEDLDPRPPNDPRCSGPIHFIARSPALIRWSA